ncbi:hypothetical protein ACTHGU_11750 [Chitinophagaceae bacterium MMS25-I14]
MYQPENTHDNEERYPLEKLVKQAFARLSCPTMSNGLYAELEKVIQQAYNMGKENLSSAFPALSRQPASE